MTQNNEHGHEVPKMPSMHHLPWSQEEARRQKWMNEKDVRQSFDEKTVIALEKMDGANACLTSDKVYARSHSGEPHRDEWDYLKKKHREEYMHKIPEKHAYFGEYLYARHSIKYTGLPAYFLVYGVYNKKTEWWYSWATTKRLADSKGFETVPEIKGPQIFNSDSDFFKMKPEGKSQYGDTREGYVLRNADGFRHKTLEWNMAKCVREDHVQTEELHWRKGGETPTNELNKNV